jgi:flagellar assembly protein FliH
LADTGFVALSFPALDTPDSRKAFQLAQSRGYAAGFAAGSQEAALRLAERSAAADAAALNAARTAQERSDAALARLNAVIRGVEEIVVPLLAEAEQTLADSAVALAETVLAAELRDGPHSARTALARALGHPEAKSVTVVRLNPADLAIFMDLPVEGVTLVADQYLARGDAIAELPTGFLDARIGAALDRARAELRGDL